MVDNVILLPERPRRRAEGAAAEKRWAPTILKSQWEGVVPAADRPGSPLSYDYWVARPRYRGLRDGAAVEVKWWGLGEDRPDYGYNPTLNPHNAVYLVVEEYAWTAGAPFPDYLLTIADRAAASLFTGLPFWYIHDLSGLRDDPAWKKVARPARETGGVGDEYRMMPGDNARIVAEQPQPGNPFPLMETA